MIYWGLLLFFILEYIRPGDRLIPAMAPLKLNTIVPLAIVIGTFLSPKRIPGQDLWKDLNSRLLLTLLTLILLSGITAAVRANTTFIFMTVLGYVLIYWVIARQATDTPRLKGVFGVIILVHVILAALTPEMFTDAEERHYLASGTFLGDGNDFALSVNVALPLCLFLWSDARSKASKVFFGAGCLFLILCIIATRSRGGSIALAVVGLYYWLKTGKSAKTAMAAGLVVLMVLAVAPASYFSRMDNIANTEEGSAQGRIKAWNAGVWMAIRNPVLGAGAGNFVVHWGKTAHSIYFLTLGELGLLGITLLITIIASNLIANRRLAQEVRRRGPPTMSTDLALLAGTSASLLAFAVAGTFLSATYYPHIYILAGLHTAARTIVRQHLLVSGAAKAAPAKREVSVHWALQRRPIGTRTA